MKLATMKYQYNMLKMHKLKTEKREIERKVNQDTEKKMYTFNNIY